MIEKFNFGIVARIREVIIIIRNSIKWQFEITFNNIES